MDDVLAIVKEDSVDQLKNHLNQADVTGSIKFTHELEDVNSIPFLDTRIVRNPDGSIKLLVYRPVSPFFFTPPTPSEAWCIPYTNGQGPWYYHRVRGCADRRRPHQILPLKVWIPRLVLQTNRTTNVPEIQAQTKVHPECEEGRHGHHSLCQWYVRSTERIFNQYNIATTMHPLSKLRSMLVHPKDKRSPEDATGVVYQLPCKDCDKVYVGETGRKFGVRKAEHKQEAETLQKAYFYQVKEEGGRDDYQQICYQ